MSGIILYDLEGEGTLVLADAAEHFSLLADAWESSVGDPPKRASRVTDTLSSTENLMTRVSGLSVWPEGAGTPVQERHQVVVPHGEPVLSALSESGHTLVRYDFLRGTAEAWIEDAAPDGDGTDAALSIILDEVADTEMLSVLARHPNPAVALTASTQPACPEGLRSLLAFWAVSEGAWDYAGPHVSLFHVRADGLVTYLEQDDQGEGEVRRTRISDVTEAEAVMGSFAADPYLYSAILGSGLSFPVSLLGACLWGQVKQGLSRVPLDFWGEPLQEDEAYGFLCFFYGEEKLMHVLREQEMFRRARDAVAAAPPPATPVDKSALLGDLRPGFLHYFW